MKHLKKAALKVLS